MKNAAISHLAVMLLVFPLVVVMGDLLNPGPSAPVNIGARA